MKRLPSDNDLTKSAVAGYVDSIAIPAYCAAAIESRQPVVAVERRDSRRVWMSVAAGVAAIALVAFAPAVVAQVQRVMQAFTVVNGRTAELRMQSVSLQQLRADMPFVVVRPANIPANYAEDIEEIGAGTGAARAMFHYSLAGQAMPSLTILESSAADRSRDGIRVEYSARGGNLPALPPPAFRSQVPSERGEHAVMKTVDNGLQRMIRITPITWVTRGTRVSFIAPPGTLTNLQLKAIVRAMR